MTTDYEEMFELAPVSLWLEDYSGLRALFERWRADGVRDLRAWLNADRARVAECSRQLQVLRVNRRTLELYGATDTQHLVANLDRVFRDAMLETHIDELVALWDGQPRFSSQTVNYSLAGERLDILVHGAVLPGHEADWRRVLAIRVAVLVRSRQFETSRDAGASSAGGAVTKTINNPYYFGDSVNRKFLMTNVDGSADSYSDTDANPNNWRYYRYRVYERVIPLRNMLWGNWG